MVTEIAVVEIITGKELEFEAALGRAVESVLSTADGYIDFHLQRGIERPSVYTFMINWETLENHTVGFRQSDLFVKWREIIGSYFLTPPQVEHWSSIANF